MKVDAQNKSAFRADARRPTSESGRRICDRRKVSLPYLCQMSRCMDLGEEAEKLRVMRCRDKCSERAKARAQLSHWKSKLFSICMRCGDRSGTWKRFDEAEPSPVDSELGTLAMVLEDNHRTPSSIPTVSTQSDNRIGASGVADRQR